MTLTASIKRAVDVERERVADDFWEALPAFLTRTTALPPPVMPIEGLLSSDGITLVHADPRSLKTWLQLEAGLGLATGSMVGGYCAVRQAVDVGYLTNEDGARRIGDRLSALLRGKGISRIPENLHLAVHRGVWLDDPDWQRRMMETVRARRLRVLMIDPLRSLTGAVDQGPRELQPFALWLRHLQQETGCVPWLSHHNSKPVAGQRDERRKPHRASGGGLFSIADAPIMLERIGETNRAIATPCGWKFSEDPPPLELSLTVEGDEARLEIKPADTTLAADAALRDRVLDYLAENPGCAGSHVAVGIHANKAAVLDTLKALETANKVDCSKAGRQNRWFLRRSTDAMVPAVPSGSRTDARNGSSGSPYGGGNRGTDDRCGPAEPVKATGGVNVERF
jgi:hypothetical protein